MQKLINTFQNRVEAEAWLKAGNVILSEVDYKEMCGFDVSLYYINEVFYKLTDKQKLPK